MPREYIKRETRLLTLWRVRSVLLSTVYREFTVVNNVLSCWLWDSDYLAEGQHWQPPTTRRSSILSWRDACGYLRRKEETRPTRRAGLGGLPLYSVVSLPTHPPKLRVSRWSRTLMCLHPGAVLMVNNELWTSKSLWIIYTHHHHIIQIEIREFSHYIWYMLYFKNISIFK